MALGQRIKEARTRAGLSQSQLAQKVGMTQAAIGALEKRDSQQSRKIVELADALGVDVTWLATGKPDLVVRDKEGKNYFIAEAKRSHSGLKDEKYDELEFIGRMDAWDSDTPLDDDEVELPLFREVELAAGDGQTQVVENHGAKLRFAKSTLSRARVQAENAACAIVRGNSMEPIMPDGTTVGVDTGNRSVRDGEIYAIDHNGMLRVKYLHRRPGGGIKIVSQNAAEHPPEEYTAEETSESIRIIGRVFWWSVLR